MCNYWKKKKEKMIFSLNMLAQFPAKFLFWVCYEIIYINFNSDCSN